MFDQPNPKFNIRAIMQDIIAEEPELITALGQDFLTEHLDAVETKLNQWQRYLANHDSEGALSARGNASRLQTYQLQRALIQRLATESQTEPFPVVHQRVLKKARQRVQHLANQRDFTNPALRTKRFEARLERVLLIELWSISNAWLKPRGLRICTSRRL